MQQGKVVLISGASRGLGQAIAELLARRGYRVFGTSRQPGPGPWAYEMLPLDVRSEESVRACVEEVVRRAGRIDVLINNAGYGLCSLIEEATLEQVQDQFDTNFFGVVRVIQAVLPVMRQQQAGRIINISSLAGQIGVPGGAFYCGSKSALEAFSESLCFEVERFGIDVCVVQPGSFETDIERDRVESGRRIAAYDLMRRGVRTSLELAMHGAAPPSEFARQIPRIIDDPRPRFRYRIARPGAWILWCMAAFLPMRVFMRTARLSFRINRWRNRAHVQHMWQEWENRSKHLEQ